ncbi:hypothetical protein [Zhongshania sp.]|uniref:hypothetical protein n=1 Tax=Zhongshania sp. TaxID=1971902 RepID=UPI0035658C5C
MSDSEVTGRIENWWIGWSYKKEYQIAGNLYDDVHGRWEDGVLFHTSGIQSKDFPIHKLQPGDVVQTRNSRYLLGEKLVMP